MSSRIPPCICSQTLRLIAMNDDAESRIASNGPKSLMATLTVRRGSVSVDVILPSSSFPNTGRSPEPLVKKVVRLPVALFPTVVPAGTFLVVVTSLTHLRTSGAIASSSLFLRVIVSSNSRAATSLATPSWSISICVRNL